MAKIQEVDNHSYLEFHLLSQTELEILRSMKYGYTSAEIASFRDCSPRTIEKHRSNIIKKLRLPSSQYTLLIWIQNNSHLLDT